MRTRRQNIQLELALVPVAKGEARSPDTQGTEARTAHAEPERPETPSNRRVRTRTHGGVGGEEPRGSPLSRLSPALRWLVGRHGSELIQVPVLGKGRIRFSRRRTFATGC